MEDLKSKAQAILTARELYDRTAELCHYNVYVELSRQYAADIAKWAMELDKEGLEQARLLGISGSVELKLLTKISSLEAQLKVAVEDNERLKQDLISAQSRIVRPGMEE